MTINKWALFYIVLLLFIVQAGHAQKIFKQDTSLTSIDYESGISLKNNQLKIDSGHCTVFNIQLSDGGDKRVDAGMNMGLIFEIPTNKDDFEISNWNKNNGYIQISGCRCINIGYNPVTHGTVRGKKLKDSTWQITAEVSAKGRQNQELIEFIFEGIVR